MGKQICTRCIMDETDPNIEFDDQGVCNHCREYDQRAEKDLYSNEEGRRKISTLINKMKNHSHNPKYDCIIGVSGGVDSSYVAYKSVEEWGLNPLLITVNNGWDTKTAKRNVDRLVEKLNVNHVEHKFHWPEFKDLQIAFLKASVPNIEIPTDHGILADLVITADKLKVPFILRGNNIVTETISPDAWGYRPLDWKYIKGIYTEYELKTYPHLSLVDMFQLFLRRSIQTIPILNYLNYQKEEAKRELVEEIGWQDYGGKHHESVFTRFFQGYILPEKFGIDIRRAYLSSLINSGQISREEALKKIKNDPYPSKEQLEKDKKTVLAKLSIIEEKWEEIMALPPKSHNDYPTNNWLFKSFSLLAEKAKQYTTSIR